jgi:hypothetical protein
MGRSQETFNKKEKEKKRAKQRQDKAEKMEERKANGKKGKSLDDMMAYIDENGNISSTPPDPRKKKIFNSDDVQIGVLGFNVLDRKMDATEQLNRWDASVTGGVGYQFGNGFNVMAAYDHGLSKADANKNFDSYNNSFKIGVGINF